MKDVLSHQMTATQNKTTLCQRQRVNTPTQKSRIMSTELHAVDSNQLCRAHHITIRRQVAVVLARENEHFYSKRPRLETVLRKKRSSLACSSEQTKPKIKMKEFTNLHKASERCILVHRFRKVDIYKLDNLILRFKNKLVA